MFAESGTSAKVPLGERATSLGPGAKKLAAVPMPSMKPLPPPASVEVIAEFAVDGGTWAYDVPKRSTHTNNLAGVCAIWPRRSPVYWRWAAGIAGGDAVSTSVKIETQYCTALRLVSTLAQ